MASLRWAGVLGVAAVAALGAQEAAVFRAGVKLVQVSVVAQDRQGKPVADLRREEFRVFDNGSAQEIRLFVAEKAGSGQARVGVTAPDTFTNQIAGARTEGAGAGRGETVVLLFDTLMTQIGDPFTEEGGWGTGKLKALHMLETLPAGDRIAIYATGRKLQVIREFTTDRASLIERLKEWKPGIDNAKDNLSILTSGGSPAENATEKELAEAVRMDTIERTADTSGELEQVAEHLMGVPGRKTILWLAQGFPVNGRALQRLNTAGATVYPVDVGGVCKEGVEVLSVKAYAAQNQPCPPRPVEQMQAIAAVTGGVAYFRRNDLEVAMVEAIEDGRVSYTLGFYQPGEDRKAAVHRLGVQVTRPGVTLRYKLSYESEPPAEVGPGHPVAELVKAMNRPVDATAMPLSAKATRVGGASGDRTAGDRLDVVATLDLASLDLELKNISPKEQRWSGKVEIAARFTGVEGNLVGEVFSQTLTLNFRPATYAAGLRGGISYHKELKIPAKAVELKLLVGSLATGKLGTLTIPLSEVKASSAR